MATRMQQRRGTASQWTSANPVLNAGEMGWESDTNKFKIGDGTNHWADLDYFIDANSTVNPSFGTSIVFEGATADSYETTLAVTDPTADRTITFPNATGTVVLADGSGNVTVSGDLTVSGTTTTINSTTINATTGIVFEGATADAYETTLTVVDATADRTITFPDVTGTVITSGNLGGITTVSNATITSPTITGAVFNDSSLVFEGSTADAFETTLSVENPTVDRTITFPDATGTVALVETVNTSLSGYVENSDIGGVSGVVGLDSLLNAIIPGTSIIIEGATDNTNETTLTITDPTADRTITFPDATGTVALTSDITVSASSTNTFSNKSISLSSNTVTATLAELNTAVSDADVASLAGTETLSNKTLTSPVITGAVFNDGSIVFEGATANDHETTFTITDPTADRTITFPDATGTVALTANVAALAGATFTGAVSGTDLTLSGNLTVNGTTTNLNSTNLVIEDKNIILGDAETPTDTTADGGGITLKGATDKTFNWVDATDAWTSSEHINLASGKTLKYNGTDLVASQSGNSGKYLTTDGTSTSWGTVSGYLAPTLGSTSIASGATVTTVAGLTLTSPTVNTPTLTLSTSSSTTDARMSWDTTNKKIQIGNGTSAIDFASSTMVTNAQGASYTTVLADKDKIIEMNVGSANNLTIPLNSSVAYPIGTVINVVQTGTGQTTVVATAGVTINGTPGLKLRAQWSAASVVKRAENTWVLLGDIAA